jgi:hypothetical protein
MTFSDNSQAVFPLSWCRSQQQFFSSPAWTYGGLISSDTLDIRHEEAALSTVQRELGNLYFRANPIAPGFVTDLNGGEFCSEETDLLDLREGFESVYRNWSDRHKRGMKRAQREGVTVRIATHTQDWLDYYEMYQTSIERWGDSVSSSYSWELFKAIKECDSHNIILWLSCLDDRPIAGALCFYAARHAVYWHGAACNDSFGFKPVQLLFYEIIRHAVENGFTTFDFNPSGGHEGVRTFKRGFGTVKQACPWYNLVSDDRPGSWRAWYSNLHRRLRIFCYDNNL